MCFMQELDSDEEYEPDLSCFNTRKSKKKRHDRRKHSQPWTLDEVVALVDGMSQFGIGQWTAVKRSYFSSSHRTATDVRVIYSACLAVSVLHQFSVSVLCVPTGLFLA